MLVLQPLKLWEGPGGGVLCTYILCTLHTPCHPPPPGQFRFADLQLPLEWGVDRVRHSSPSPILMKTKAEGDQSRLRPLRSALWAKTII